MVCVVPFPSRCSCNVEAAVSAKISLIIGSFVTFDIKEEALLLKPGSTSCCEFPKLTLSK